MKEYRIYIHSNQHPRKGSTPRNGRTNFSVITVQGEAAMRAKVAELRAAGTRISEVCTGCGIRVAV